MLINAFSLLMEYEIIYIIYAFLPKFGKCSYICHVLEHFWYNSEVYMVSKNVKGT